MRISTASVYQDAVTNFNDMQSAIANSINEVSSGIALTSPAVNPTASSQVLIATQSGDLNTQYGVNRANANDSLNTSDGVLSGVTNLMQNLAGQIVAAGSGALTGSDRTSIATQMQSSLSQLMTLANSTDSNGNYVFSGSTVGTEPYTATSNGAVYNGNQNTQMLQVDSAQQLPVTMVGSAIFGNITVSPNTYFSTASASNTSTATMSNGTLVNAAAVTQDNYAVTFTSPTTYSVTDTSTGVVVPPASNAYTSGAALTIAGVQYSITNGAAPNGVPATGDQFNVQPGNQNIFQVLTNAITALKTGTATPGGQTNLANALAQANTSISASMNNVLNARDQIGNSLQQISSLNNVGQTVGLAITTTISDLQDANYAQVVSQLSQEQFTYKAAQQAFASTSQLSLLSLIR